MLDDAARLVGGSVIGQQPQIGDIAEEPARSRIAGADRGGGGEWRASIALRSPVVPRLPSLAPAPASPPTSCARLASVATSEPVLSGMPGPDRVGVTGCV